MQLSQTDDDQIRRWQRQFPRYDGAVCVTCRCIWRELAGTNAAPPSASRDDQERDAEGYHAASCATKMQTNNLPCQFSWAHESWRLAGGGAAGETSSNACGLIHRLAVDTNASATAASSRCHGLMSVHPQNLTHPACWWGHTQAAQSARPELPVP